jgi:hypothetical protein
MAYLQSQRQIGELQSLQMQANAQLEQMRMDGEKRRQAAKASMTPAASSSTLKGLTTIATSPLGDLSEPVIGKRKLLGN